MKNLLKEKFIPFVLIGILSFISFYARIESIFIDAYENLNRYLYLQNLDLGALIILLIVVLILAGMKSPYIKTLASPIISVFVAPIVILGILLANNIDFTKTFAYGIFAVCAVIGFIALMNTKETFQEEDTNEYTYIKNTKLVEGGIIILYGIVLALLSLEMYNITFIILILTIIVSYIVNKKKLKTKFEDFKYRWLLDFIVAFFPVQIVMHDIIGIREIMILTVVALIGYFLFFRKYFPTKDKLEITQH